MVKVMLFMQVRKVMIEKSTVKQVIKLIHSILGMNVLQVMKITKDMTYVGFVQVMVIM
jgi:hypothetical protein